MGGGIGGILFWVIGSVVAGILQKRTFIQQPKEHSNFISILVLFLITYTIIFLTSFVIPSSILDYGWYRAFWIIFLPILIGYTVIKGCIRKNEFITLKGIKITNQNITKSLFLITYTFPLSQIAINLLLWALGIW